MSNPLKYIVHDIVSEIITEQQQNESSPFSKHEQRFLGSFAAANSQQLGIIYSISDIGVREFVARSGTQYGCTPAILLSMLRDKYIKIVPYTGHGQNTDYTIELQLPLESVQQYASLVGKKDGEGDAGAPTDTSSASSSGGGSFGGGGGLPSMDSAAGPDLDLGDAEGAADIAEPDAAAADEPAEPEPELAHVVKYGDLIKESVTIAKKLMLEASKSKKKSSNPPQVKIYSKQSRILNRLPKGYVYHLTKVIEKLTKKTYNKMDKERLIADVLDNMQVNFNLSDKQMHRSYEFYRNQKRLQKFLDKD